MPFFKKKQTQKRERRQELAVEPEATVPVERPAAEPQVTVRVERPGYSTHEVPMPATHLSSQHFAPLMATAEKAYGVQQGDVIAIPGKLKDVLDAMVSTTIGAPSEPLPVVHDGWEWWRLGLAVEDGYVDDRPLKTR